MSLHKNLDVDDAFSTQYVSETNYATYVAGVSTTQMNAAAIAAPT